MSTENGENAHGDEELLDITKIFKNAATKLTNSDSILCNKETFNLQDSMAALELMDRKMDCCEIPMLQVVPFGREIKEEDKDRWVFPRPAPTGLDDATDPLPWNDLSIEGAAHIALHCLVRLESMLGGASVVESTFTCLYAHQPVVIDMKEKVDSLPSDANDENSIAQRVVFASVLLLLELTDVIRGIVLNADIYEEEDFTVSTYSIKTFEERDEDTALKAATAALEHLTAANGTISESGQSIALILRYQLDLLAICASLARLAGKQVQKTLEQAQKLSRTALIKLEDLQKRAQRMKENESDDMKSLLQKVFNSDVNRPLVGNAPVRKVIFQKLEDSISSMKTITSEIDWALCKTMLKGNTLGRARRMLRLVSISSVNILTRSLLVLNMYFDEQLFGQHSLQDTIKKHMQQLSSIPDEVFQITATQAFLGRLAKPIYDVLKVLVLNRNRQRPYIEAVMFPDWANLSSEARILDTALQGDSRFADLPPHFSLYVLYLTLDLMDHFVALSLELELICGEEELGIAFWYRDFLLSALVNQLTTMRQSRAAAKQAQQAAATAVAAKRGKKKGGKNKKNNNNINTRQEPTPHEIEEDFEFLLVNLKRVLCRGIVRFTASAKQAGLIQDKVFEFTSKARVFEKRFEAFSSIEQPPKLDYKDYVAGSDFSKVQPMDLIQSTAECFSASKAYVDRLLAQLPVIGTDFAAMQEDELRRLAKVCVGNSVYLQKLKQAIGSKDDDTATGKITSETSTHKQFCTFKIN